MKINLFFQKILIVFGLFSANFSSGQNVSYWNPSLAAYCDSVNSSDNWIQLKNSANYTITSFINSKLNDIGIGPNDSISLLREKTEGNQIHKTYKQYHSGVKVDKSLIHFHEENGKLYLINGDWASNLSTSNYSLSDSTVLQMAMINRPADVYLWEDTVYINFAINTLGLDSSAFMPQINLKHVKILEDLPFTAANTRLIKEVKLSASSPEFSVVFWFNPDGSILKTTDDINNCINGTVCTPYYGTKNVLLDYDSLYLLRDTCRGNGITTLINNSNTTYIGNDTSVNYSAECNAGVIHWATEKFYDLLDTTFNRNSLDDNGIRLVSQLYENSIPFFNPGNPVITYVSPASYQLSTQIARFGKSSVLHFDPNKIDSTTFWNAIDIIGHEWGHGVTGYTANLSFTGERGALNESISDFFGFNLERFSLPHFDWTIGEDIYDPNAIPGFTRSMQDPNLNLHPKTKNGTFWNNSDPIHEKAGVPNHFFYLLCNGGTGTNNDSTGAYTYNLSGIDIDTVNQIIYRALDLYLSPFSNFCDAKRATEQSALELYGNYYKNQVEEAWLAVGVKCNNCISIYIDSLISESCPFASDGKVKLKAIGGTPPYTVNWTNGLDSGNTFSINNLSITNSTLVWNIVVSDSFNCSNTFNQNLSQFVAKKPVFNGPLRVQPLFCIDSTGFVDVFNNNNQLYFNQYNAISVFNDGDTTFQKLNLTEQDTGLFSTTIYYTFEDSTQCSIQDSIQFYTSYAPDSSVYLSDFSCISNYGAKINLNRNLIPSLDYHYEVLINDSIIKIIDTTFNSFSNPVLFSIDSIETHANITVKVSTSSGYCFEKYFTTGLGNHFNHTLTPESCPIRSDGQIKILNDSTFFPVSYNWSTGDTSATIDSLITGNYSVSISYPVSNPTCSTTFEFFVDQLAVMEFDLKSKGKFGCDSSILGSASIAITNGTTPYDIKWNGNPSLYTNIIDSLEPGWHTVEVTDDNGCIKIDSIEVKGITHPNGATITTNTTWNDVVYYFDDDLVVDSSVTLTLSNCQLNFSKGNKLIINRNAKVYSYDSTKFDAFTDCEQLWDGITIYGQSYQGFIADPHSSDNHNGFLYLHESQIKNAEIGIYSGWEHDFNHYEKYRNGQFQAIKSEFINNYIAIKIQGYHFANFSGEKFFPDSIRASNFTTTRNVLEYNTSHKDFINITDFNMLVLSSNFKNANPLDQSKGNGIISRSYGFDKTPEETPTYYLPGEHLMVLNSSFDGLDNGIRTASIQYHLVYDNEFRACKNASLSFGNIAVRNDSNNFNINKISNNDVTGVFQLGYGFVRNFDNSFEATSQTPPNAGESYGVLSENVFYFPGVTFKNIFKELDISLQTQGDNTNQKIKCNNITPNTTTSFPSWVTLPKNGLGALRNQGSKRCFDLTDGHKYAAGNLFTDECDPLLLPAPNPNPPNDVYTHPSIVFDYYAHFRDLDLVEKTRPFCSSFWWNNNNHIPCASAMQTTSCSNENMALGLRPYDKERPRDVTNYLNELSEAEEEVNGIISLKNNQIDSVKENLNSGSNEAQLLADISNSELADTSLVEKLLNASPLNNVVIDSLLHRQPVLGDSNLIEVLTENLPLAPNQIQFLYFPIGVDYSTTLADSIAWLNAYAPKDSLRELMAVYFSEKDYFTREHNIIYSELAFVNYQNNDEENYLAQLDNSPYANHKYEKVNYLIAKHDLEGLSEAESAYLGHKDVKGTQEAIQFENYVDVITTLIEEETLIDQITTDTKNDLYNIANSHTLVSYKAKALLEVIDDTLFSFSIEKIPNTGLKRGGYFIAENPEPIVNYKLDGFKVYPNPNSGIFNLIIPEKKEKLFVTIFNALGQSVYSKELPKNQPQILLDIKEFGQGIYYLIVHNQKQIMYNEKIQLAR